VGTLSGGERARLALAAALASAPDPLLLDEPSNDLDDHMRVLGAKTIISRPRMSAARPRDPASASVGVELPGRGPGRTRKAGRHPRLILKQLHVE
jgi:hypothetical protein